MQETFCKSSEPSKNEAIEVQPSTEEYLGKPLEDKQLNISTNIQNNAKITWSAIYNKSDSKKISMEKPSVYVRSLKNIKINDNVVDFDINKLAKPRTVYVVKTTNINNKSCLQIESKRNIAGIKCPEIKKSDAQETVFVDWVDSKENQLDLEKTEKDNFDKKKVELPIQNEKTKENCDKKKVELPKKNEKTKENFVKKELELPINNEMVSLLDAFDSTEAISKIFNFPCENRCMNNKKVNSNEENASAERSKLIVDTPVIISEHRSKEIIDISQTLSAGDHSYWSEKKTKRKFDQTEQQIKKRHTRSKTDISISRKRPLEQKNSSIKKKDSPNSNYINFDGINNSVGSQIYICAEIEVLEYVFKYYLLPGSYYMDRLSKNLKLPWKNINFWFNYRRNEDKKNFVNFRRSELTHCLYCDINNEITKPVLEHLTSELHIRNVKTVYNLRIKSFENTTEEFPADKKYLNLELDDSTQDNTVPGDFALKINNDTSDAYNYISNICQICKTYFPNKWSLQRHSITHRPMQCEWCNLTFSHSNYQKHVTSHLMENTTQKINRYCRCQTCHQLECECQIIEKSINENSNDCKCRPCRKLEREFHLIVDPSSQCKKECKLINGRSIESDTKDYKYELDNITDYEDVLYSSSSICDRKHSGTTKLLKKYVFESVDTSIDLLQMWTNIRKQENINEIFLSEQNTNEDFINSDLFNSHQQFDEMKHLHNTKEDSEIYSLLHKIPQGCLNKFTFFDEMTDENRSFLFDGNYPTFRMMKDDRSCMISENKSTDSILTDDILFISNENDQTDELGENNINTKVNKNGDCNGKEFIEIGNIYKKSKTETACSSSSKQNMETSIAEKVIFNANSFEENCLLCHKGSFTSSELLMHTQVHNHVKKQFLCNECGICINGFRNCVEHIFQHLNIFLYLCPFCFKRFPKYQDIIHHLKIVHSFVKINQQSSYNWISKVNLDSLDDSKENNKSDNLIFENESNINMPDSIDSVIENLVVEDANPCQNIKTENYHEETFDLSQIPDNIAELDNVFENVFLTDKLKFI